VIVVTGAAGFIGGRVADALHDRGYDVLGIDRAELHENGRGRGAFADALDPGLFLEHMENGASLARRVEAVIHQGACVDTMVRDWSRLRTTNVEYPARLLQACIQCRIPFIYASSGAVYGAEPGEERPLNEYGRSKLVFDRYVRRLLPTARSPIIGLRYFNVYGVGESHKGRMASVVFQLFRQLELGQPLRLFGACDGYSDGEQLRDFVAVDDVVNVNLWFLDRGGPSGIYDVGTGTSVTFNRIAELVIASRGAGTIEYVPFPAGLRGRYQTFTRSNVAQLRAAGSALRFTAVEDGIPRYIAALASHAPA
jgi:ADP-L-glycero-D-manno-heptose 6-epimerase